MRAAVAALQAEKAQLTKQLSNRVDELMDISDDLGAAKKATAEREAALQKVQRSTARCFRDSLLEGVLCRVCRRRSCSSYHARGKSYSTTTIPAGLENFLEPSRAALPFGGREEGGCHHPVYMCMQDLRAAEESLRLALREHEETAGSSRDQAFSLQVIAHPRVCRLR